MTIAMLSTRSVASKTGCHAWSLGSSDLCTACSQVATACNAWRQSAADEESGGDTSSSDILQLPFWLLAKPEHGSWQAEPLTAWKRVSCLPSVFSSDRGLPVACLMLCLAEQFAAS